MITRTFTENAQFVVPSWVDEIECELWGGEGWNPNDHPLDERGLGGYVKARVKVTPNEALAIYVGKRGSGTLGGAGGARGGDGSSASFQSAEWSGGGGGSSELRRGATRILVAGGGGGQGGWTTGLPVPSGGHGGGLTGQAGLAGASGAQGGGGGTQSAGGAGGAGRGGVGGGTPGTAAFGGSGGAPGASSGFGGAGGGGGGGYFGGGGGGGGTPHQSDPAQGFGGGGGGGSSFAGHADVIAGTVVHQQGVRMGNGAVIVRHIGRTPDPPTNVRPAQGSIITTPTPIVRGTIRISDTTQFSPVTLEWQLATDAAFTQNVRTILWNNGNTVHYNTDLGQSVPESLRLTQGIWFIRARAIDEDGQASAYTSPQSFEVRSAPTTTAHHPTGDASLEWVNGGIVGFSWQLSASVVGGQSAYQVRIETAGGALVYDTSKVVSSATIATIDLPDNYKNMALRWRVRIWDADDNVGPYSDFHLFRVGDGPVVSINNLDTITNPNPTITWTTTPGDAAVREHRVVIRRKGDGVTVYDSGWYRE